MSNPRPYFWTAVVLLVLARLALVLLLASLLVFAVWLVLQVRASRSGALDRNDW